MRFTMNDRGAALVEHGLLLGLLSVVAVSAVLALGERAEAAFTSSADAVELAMEPPSAPTPSARTHGQHIENSGSSSFPDSPTGETFPGPLSNSSNPAAVCRLLGYETTTNPTITSLLTLTSDSHPLASIYELDADFNFNNEGVLTRHHGPGLIQTATVIGTISCD